MTKAGPGRGAAHVSMEQIGRRSPRATPSPGLDRKGNMKRSAPVGWPLLALALAVAMSPSSRVASVVAHLIKAVTAGGVEVGQHAGPAFAEHARLTYTLYAHHQGGAEIVRQAVVNSIPGETAEFPSQFLEVNGKKVEYVMVPAVAE